MMRKSFFLLTILLVVCFFTMTLSVARADETGSAAEFYKNKVVSFVLGYPPGAGMDFYARLMVPFLEKYLGTTVVVKNMPGAGGVYAYNYVYNKKPDGLTICMPTTDGMVMPQVLKAEGVKYDFRKFKWLGRIGWAKRAVLVAKNSNFHTLDDLKNAKHLKFAGSGRTSSSGLTLILLAHSMGISPQKVTCVFGYSGGRANMMSVMQGETDMTTLTDTTTAEYVRGGLIRAFLIVDNERSKYLPDVPTYYELYTPPPELDWPLQFYMGLQRLRRSFVTQPGVPADRVAFLREALAKSLKDKELLAAAAKKNMPLDYMSGSEVQKQIEEKLGTLSEQQLTEFKKIALTEYQ